MLVRSPWKIHLGFSKPAHSSWPPRFAESLLDCYPRFVSTRPLEKGLHRNRSKRTFAKRAKPLGKFCATYPEAQTIQFKADF
ncbi:hypothetical protein RSSM_04143 [Rhodopirellula sallentina SM41]|uniref:Uncharacterized protein n=1 Tax=Rhodopirellula sallentina SM41 TaxID=1263870 RepID=M5TYY6_9BACT|nr:hypothetical protein RSSM_04143 [Rhodopirellula sallentina SM41]